MAQGTLARNTRQTDKTNNFKLSLRKQPSFLTSGPRARKDGCFRWLLQTKQQGNTTPTRPKITMSRTPLRKSQPQQYVRTEIAINVLRCNDCLSVLLRFSWNIEYDRQWNERVLRCVCNSVYDRDAHWYKIRFLVSWRFPSYNCLCFKTSPRRNLLYENEFDLNENEPAGTIQFRT